MNGLLCRILGHRWQDSPIRYEQGATWGYDTSEPHRRRLMHVAWICDETCTRCGAETWWPA